MRIELILDNSRPTRIPINYNHPLASCIYKNLGSSSSDYADRLHNRGYEFGGKHFKLFTFSQLLASRCRALGDQLLIQDEAIRWLISSPADEFVIHFANGILDCGRVCIGEVNFPIREVRTVAEPEFTESMRFRCLSPITVSTHTDAEGLNHLQYCRLGDGFYEKIADNLRRKRAVLGSVGSGSNVPAPIVPSLRGGVMQSTEEQNEHFLEMEFDPLVIAKRQGRIHKLISYKNTKIFSYYCPFTARGSPELMRIGYQCGFGDGNSKGFGMVEVDR
jgi:CRISPR-associated endoribonuclease Cas6